MSTRLDPAEPARPVRRRPLGTWQTWRPHLAAAASGLLLSFAFPPLELGPLAWVGLVPLLLVPVPGRVRQRAWLGWLFGYVHFAVSLFWLNEIGFGAGLLLAVFCALFPMAWFLLATWLAEAMAGGGGHGGVAAPGDTRLASGHALRQRCLRVVALPVLWVATEWLRAWLFTGFPWNQLGVSQWQHLTLLRVTTVTGVYGISFLVVVVNVAVSFALAQWWRQLRHGEKGKVPWELALAASLALLLLVLPGKTPPLGEPKEILRVLAIQGNIPQCRVWSQDQLDLAIDVYTSLSAAAGPAAPPDLIVWPETAVPAALRSEKQYSEAMDALVRRVRTPFLLGSIDYRESPAVATRNVSAEGVPDPGHQVHNSVFLIGEDGTLRGYYDKTHLVPFGEYTPGGNLFPWLVDLIGMGRSLTPGTAFTVLQLPRGAQAGANICYEDAYAGISREFVRRGANVLMTLTNDAWYAESAGPRQHLVHAVFRAVENRRPLFRSGNNSDTCLILPSGEITGLLCDPVTGSRFARGSRTYEVPVWDDLGNTFYSVHGDVFARGCALASLAALVCLCGRSLSGRQSPRSRTAARLRR